MHQENLRKVHLTHFCTLVCLSDHNFHKPTLLRDEITRTFAMNDAGFKSLFIGLGNCNVGLHSSAIRREPHTLLAVTHEVHSALYNQTDSDTHSLIHESMFRQKTSNHRDVNYSPNKRSPIWRYSMLPNRRITARMITIADDVSK